MSTYAIGDIQGCHRTLLRLLDAVRFDPAADRVWLVGDLVNRGPDSLATLRWAKGLGDRLVSVLGNHDLHLLAVAAGIRKRRSKDTLDPVLTAPDRDELLEWLRGRPLLHREGRRLLVHAGLLPVWSLEEALGLGDALSAALRGDAWRDLLASSYAKRLPKRWHEGLSEGDRLALALAVFTHLRACGRDGATLDRSRKGPPSYLPPHLLPWFEHPQGAGRGVTVVCGHWAALGVRIEEGLVALDSGCVWGRTLTAYRLEDGAVTQVPNSEASRA